MCTRPIYIYNPSRRWRFNQPLRIAVPCGHCEECAKIKRDEWFFRSLVEYNHFIKIGGCAYFVTLSYNDDELPYITTPEGKRIKAFNRSHIRSFCKYVRTWLKRHGYPYLGFKFLICSEYGGHSTKRPHYHGILFLPFKLNYWTDKIPLSDRYYTNKRGTKRMKLPFTYFITSVWTHGYVVCSKLGWEIKSVGGIKYASKYITKDMEYIRLRGLRKYFDNSDYKQWIKENAEYFPKHWQSVGYGSSFCEEIAKQKNIPQFLLSSRASVCGLDKSVSIPRYYHYKFEKQINKAYSKALGKVVVEPTQIGLDVKRLRLEQSILKDMDNLHLLTSELIDTKLPSTKQFEDSFNKFKDKFFNSYVSYAFDSSNYPVNQIVSVNDSYDNVRKMLVDTLPQMISSCGLYRLSLYRLFIRFMPLYYDECPEYKFSEVSSIISQMVQTSVCPPEYENVICPSCFDDFGYPLSDNHHLKRLRLCMHDKYFETFEKTCYLLDVYFFCVGLQKNETLFEKRIKNEEIRDKEGSRPSVYCSIK